MFDSSTIAIRFALDATFLTAAVLPEPFVKFSLVYNGPKELESVTCKDCQNTLLDGRWRVKSAPSDHW